MKESSSFTESDLSLFNSGFDFESNGKIYFSRELSSNVYCSMDHRKFPHDVQHCEMVFGSYNHDISVLNFTYNIQCFNLSYASCNIVNVLHSSAFEISSITGQVKSAQWERIRSPLLVITITLVRKLSFYFYQVNMYVTIPILVALVQKQLDLRNNSQIATKLFLGTLQNRIGGIHIISYQRLSYRTNLEI